MSVEIVMLSEADMERAARVAYLRNSSKSASPNHRVDAGTTDYDMHFAGVRAELAVCRLFNFPLDERFGPDGDNGKPDLYAGDLRVEVKTSFHSPPHLKLNTLAEFTSDVVVMCCTPFAKARNASVIEVWGCVSRLRFHKEYQLDDYNYGPRAVFKNFSPIAVLKQFSTKAAA